MTEEIKNPEHEQLLEVLKFMPCTYKIMLWGYGGEKVMGRVSQDSWDYCVKHQVDLGEIAWGNGEYVERLDLDPDQLPFRPGEWYECDNFAHANGVSANGGTLQINDENGDTVIEQQLDDFEFDDGPEFEVIGEAWITQHKTGDIVFIGQSNEKGTFFEAEINLTAPFDIKKLKLFVDNIEDEEFVTGVEYDGEYIDNQGGNTDGKSSDFYMFRVVDDEGNAESYDPGERDWGEPAVGTSPSNWERSPKFDFNEHKPVHPGYYNCTWGGWGTTYGTAYWNGTEFGEWQFGVFKPFSEVYSWSGYNWDTSDWANQPPEPPEVKCNHEGCNWTGMRSDMIEDEDHSDICPKCSNNDWDWIDYDPDYANGRENRELYIK
jgi:hypothetical protein